MKVSIAGVSARVLLVAFLLGMALRPLPAPGAAAVPAPTAKSRAVSLTALQQAFRQLKPGQQPARELLLLCGLTRLDGYLWDRRHKDVILVGQVDPSAAPLYTEDLVVALRNAGLRYLRQEKETVYYYYPGCSIDPDVKTIQQLTDLSQKIGATTSTTEIEALTKQWEEVAATPQPVSVRGVPPQSHFALVMVTADYYLKRMVDGSVESGVPGVTSLVDLELAKTKEELRTQRKLVGPLTSYNRFWFFPGQVRFGVEGEQVSILSCPVTLLTEEQYLSASGVAGRGKPTPLAEQFVQSFTAHYADIAKQKPLYQQLEDLFRYVSLAQAMRFQKVDVDLGYLVRRYPVQQASVPTQVPGVSRIVRYQLEPTELDLQGGYVVMPSCGGVSINMPVTARNFEHAKRPAGKGRQGRAAAKSKALTARPSATSLYWDY